MKRFYSIVLTLAIIICFSGSAIANSYYVATPASGGDDSNPGTSTQPWATLQHAVDTIFPGDTILVKTGTYVGFRAESSGLPGAVKTIKADVGANVLVNVPGPFNRHSSNIEFENFDATVKYWVIDGFEVADSPKYGIDLRDTDYITVRNCDVHDSAVTGIFTAFTYHPLIQNNESAFNGEHGIYQSNSGDFPTIVGNYLHHNFAAGIHMNGDKRFKPGDGIISYGIIENNIILENGLGGGSGINMDGVSDSIVQNNLLYDNHASGISLYAIDGAEGSSRNKIYNNTIVMAPSSRWCINIPKSAKGRPNPTGNKIKNNILYTPSTTKGSVLIYSSTASSFESDYNVVVNRFSASGGKRIITLAQWKASGYDQQSIISTPNDLFVNPTNDDYYLKNGSPGSPAINAGTSLTEVTDDLDGISRPKGSAYDIGCYESQ
ncbi:MAG: Polysaccharide lyase [Candidatus Dadabacteria bacterium]|nr:Polysaccharide lyase [Candidatus Dadabacteria bacterium]